jgi:hypothetical protein
MHASMKAAQEALRGQGASVGATVADFLDKHLASDSHGYCYNPANATASWTVNTDGARAA